MEEEKKKAYQIINIAWQNAKPLFDDSDNGDAWEKALMLLTLEKAKLQEDELALLDNISMALWDYVSYKNHKMHERNKK